MLTRLRASDFIRGARFTIRLLSDRETFGFVEFLENELPESDRKQVLARLERASEVGPPRNVEQCRDLGDEIFELKTKNVRIFWFYDKGRLILVSHAKLKKDVRITEEKRKALAIRGRYLAEGADLV
jgi:phage-related protein